MKYFFILGNNTAISLAELFALLPDIKKGELIRKNVFIFKTEKNLDFAKLMARLGGTVKIGKIDIETKNDLTRLTKTILKLSKTGNNKYHFGFSDYTVNKLNLKFLGMSVKKNLKNKGISCRWVASREKELSSVMVKQNKLITNGQEFCLFSQKNKILIGETKAVQDFKAFSLRDYGRPARDDFSGMLPPKLARIMINIAQIEKNATILDPFCGSGTVLTEALLMGYNNLIGSDISTKALNDTRKNISWLQKKFALHKANITIKNIDVTKISQNIKPGSVDVVVTEPYLGEQRGKINITNTINKLEILYTKALQELKVCLKPNGKIIMVWPVWQQKKLINPQTNDLKIIVPLPQHFVRSQHIVLSQRNNLLYGRPKQRVWREIVILKKLSS